MSGSLPCCAVETGGQQSSRSNSQSSYIISAKLLLNSLYFFMQIQDLFFFINVKPVTCLKVTNWYYSIFYNTLLHFYSLLAQISVLIRSINERFWVKLRAFGRLLYYNAFTACERHKTSKICWITFNVAFEILLVPFERPYDSQ